jgi:hypothetical protein
MHYRDRKKNIFLETFFERSNRLRAGGEAEEGFQGESGLDHGKKGEAE